MKINHGEIVGQRTPELISERRSFCNSSHQVSDGNDIIKQGTCYWVNITTENPLPQQPDFIPVGMEMWEERGKYDTYVFYSDGVGSFRTKNLPEKRLHAFAVKSATGKVHLMNSPVWFTREDNGMLLHERIEGYELRAEVLGAIMVKGEE